MWKSENSQIHNLLMREVHKADQVGSSKHSAAVVYRGKVVSVGHNKWKSHPIMLRYHRRGQVYLHAEVDAILKAVHKIGVDMLGECDIYCLRINAKSEVVGNSKPCVGCSKLIQSFNLRGVYWT